MTQQLKIDFTPGLTQQFPEFIDLIAAVVYGARGGIKSVAADLDLSPGQLSRMLSRDTGDRRYFPAELVPALVESTQDKRPVYWMVEKFLEDEDAKRRRAVDELTQMLPAIQQALEAVK